MTTTLELLAFGGLCVGWGMVAAYAFERGKVEGINLSKDNDALRHDIERAQGTCSEYLNDNADLEKEIDQLKRINASLDTECAMDMERPKPTPKKTKKSRTRK